MVLRNKNAPAPKVPRRDSLGGSRANRTIICSLAQLELWWGGLFAQNRLPTRGSPAPKVPMRDSLGGGAERIEQSPVHWHSLTCGGGTVRLEQVANKRFPAVVSCAFLTSAQHRPNSSFAGQLSITFHSFLPPLTCQNNSTKKCQGTSIHFNMSVTRLRRNPRYSSNMGK